LKPGTCRGDEERVDPVAQEEQEKLGNAGFGRWLTQQVYRIPATGKFIHLRSVSNLEV